MLIEYLPKMFTLYGVWQTGYPLSARAQSPELTEKRGARSGGDSGSGGEGTSGNAACDASISGLSEDDKKRKSFEHGEVTGHNKDWRNFHCKTWHLEPTVR